MQEDEKRKRFGRTTQATHGLAERRRVRVQIAQTPRITRASCRVFAACMEARNCAAAAAEMQRLWLHR